MTQVTVFDIETDNVDIMQISKVHTGAFAYEGTVSATACDSETLRERLDDSSAIVGHNIIRYDLPALARMRVVDDYYIEGMTSFSEEGTPLYHVADTLLLSRLLSPETIEHSLESWGEKLGIEKLRVTDWKEQPLSVYQERCKTDVKINLLVWDALREGAFKVDKAYKTEAHFADIIAKQVRNGFTFDTELALKVCKAIEERMQTLERSVLLLMPKVAMNKGDLKRHLIPSFKPLKNGKLSAAAQRFLDRNDATYNPDTRCIELSDGTIVKPWEQSYVRDQKPLSLDNREGMKNYLISLGWEPEYWNYKKDKKGKMIKIDRQPVRASPKIRNEEAICMSLLALMESSPNLSLIIKSYISYSIYKHRLSSLEGMLEDPRLEIDGKLGADMNTLGAATGRVTHKVVANIPKTLNEFDSRPILIEGVEDIKHAMRACFRASEGYELVGIDACALEAVVEAHYVYKYEGGKDYGLALIQPKPHDIHTINAMKLGIKRELAKRVKYALGYGAAIAKLMVILRCSKEEAERIYEQYWQSAACVKMFLEDQKQYWENHSKRIRAIDGRHLFVDSPHKLLNYQFQSTGTILMKNAACIMDARLRKERLYRFAAVRKVCDYHDEFQFECDKKIADLSRYVGEIGVESIEQASQRLGLNVPVTGEFKIGRHWGETH